MLTRVLFSAVFVVLVQISAASTALSVDSYSLGGASAILNLGNDSTQMGVVLGQGFAGAPTYLSADSSERILPGFWIEVASLENETPIPTRQVAFAASRLSVQFRKGFAQVGFHLDMPTQGTVRLVNMQGRVIGATWSQSMSAGAHQVEFAVATQSSQPVFLIVTAGAVQRTFQFIPNK